MADGGLASMHALLHDVAMRVVIVSFHVRFSTYVVCLVNWLQMCIHMLRVILWKILYWQSTWHILELSFHY